jgi:hypothetical protein
MEGLVEVRESYFKNGNGTIFMRRQIGNQILFEGPAQVAFISWDVADLPWNRKPVLELVKEGPKELVVYGG